MPRLPALLIATFVASFSATLALDASGAPRPVPAPARVAVAAEPPAAPAPACRPVRVVYQGLGEAGACR